LENLYLLWFSYFSIFPAIRKFANFAVIAVNGIHSQEGLKSPFHTHYERIAQIIVSPYVRPDFFECLSNKHNNQFALLRYFKSQFATLKEYMESESKIYLI